MRSVLEVILIDVCVLVYNEQPVLVMYVLYRVLFKDRKGDKLFAFKMVDVPE